MIDKCFILALDKRKILSFSLAEDCRKRGFDTELFVVGDGSDPTLKYNHVDKPGLPDTWKFGQGISAQRHYWAFQSHKEIVKLSIKRKYDRILLLEDDAYFTDRFDKIWPSLCEEVDSDFDILYLGWHAYAYHNHMFAGQNLVIEEDYAKTGQHNIITIPQCGGLFACVISKRIFPLICNMPAVSPVDSQLNVYRPLIRSYNVVPCIAYVREGWSFCENTYIPRDKL